MNILKLLSIVLLALSASACTTVVQAPPKPQGPTLLVLSDRADSVALFASNRTGRLATLMPGATCVNLPPGPTGYALGFRALSTDETFWSDLLPFESFAGWQIRLSQTLWIDITGLQPGPPCRKGHEESSESAA